MRVLIPLLLAVSCAGAQTEFADRLTFSGGWTRQVGGYSFEPKETALGLGLSYGHRFHKYIEAETGVFTALGPTRDVCSRLGCFNVNDRFFWVPFGVRFIAPLYLGRIEFSAGGGGMYEHYSPGDLVPYGPTDSRDGVGGYAVASAAVAFDHGHRFWLGATPRLFLANSGPWRDRWFQISGEFSVRFR
jgi:hypothetical protein